MQPPLITYLLASFPYQYPYLSLSLSASLFPFLCRDNHLFKDIQSTISGSKTSKNGYQFYVLGLSFVVRKTKQDIFWMFSSHVLVGNIRHFHLRVLSLPSPLRHTSTSLSTVSAIISWTTHCDPRQLTLLSKQNKNSTKLTRIFRFRQDYYLFVLREPFSLSLSLSLSLSVQAPRLTNMECQLTFDEDRVTL